jgi:hypothetical protein
MHKSTCHIGIALIVLVFASLACGLGGDKEPTATPVPPAATQAPPPTNTPEPEPIAPVGNMVPAESETLGVRLSYPEDWFYDDSFFIVLSNVPDADLSGDEMPEGVVMFIMAGPSDEMEMEGSPEDIVGEQLGESGDMEFLGDPVETAINGVPVTIVEFRATEEGETIHGKVAIYDNGAQAAMAMAFSPEELWDEHAATVDAILESIELFEGGGFDFGITPEEGEWRGYLVYGDLVSDEFAGGDVHNWTFDGSAGEYVTVILTPLEEDMDVTIQLLASDGTSLLDVDEEWAGEAEILLDYELPDDGEYTIIVQELFEEAGPYELELWGSPDPMGAIVPPDAIEQGELVVGETFVVTLAESEKHAWTLYSTGVSQRVSVALTPDEEMDVVLSIIAPDGTMLVDELDEVGDGEPEVAQCVTLEQEGQYIVVVDEFWDMTAGEYSLEVSDCGDGSGYTPGDDYVVTEMGEIAYGESQQGELSEGPYIHSWLLSGGTGDVVTIVVEPLTTDADL